MFPVLSPEGVGLPGLIALIAVTHVFVAHFAVGGGMYLVTTERWGRKLGRPGLVGHAERHSRFFVLLTLVFGALSGVGIWFAIGLASPDSTFFLIRTFVWGWATEWCFFLIELTAAVVYYKTWRRIDDKTHMAVGWVYALASITTLLVINGILSFMLSPGAWHETKSFWSGVFNPTYWPTTFLRLGVCAFVAGSFGLFTARHVVADDDRRLVIARAGRWIVSGLVVAAACFVWTRSALPADAAGILERSLDGARGGVPLLATLYRLGGIAFGVLFLVGLVCAVAKPTRLPRAAALGLLALGLFGFGCAEYAREVLRKPYSVRDVIYANGIYRDELEHHREVGFLTSTPEAHLLQGTDDLAIGDALYRRQCAVCHTLDGYRGLDGLLEGWDTNRVGTFLTVMSKQDPARAAIWSSMPPLAANQREVDALRTWMLARLKP
ncbi:MAG: cytochrome ubiquinol oxidase subunit I [Planctomycetota bacterium]|nr:cytochrome ubiquinol oxidase subunit I [Planctomycetota bacterium]MCB9825315.1 cytochrome ubiquinol oxidase subunit I [Planctomycetota bacterium]MCB9900801.1 cytochrome ubiquinol oxidase subunit I [Planctomycetota bacterium]